MSGASIFKKLAMPSSSEVGRNSSKVMFHDLQTSQSHTRSHSNLAHVSLAAGMHCMRRSMHAAELLKISFLKSLSRVTPALFIK